jgi:hypothetical protein
MRVSSPSVRPSRRWSACSATKLRWVSLAAAPAAADPLCRSGPGAVASVVP